jgi:hypothetical protein
MTMASGIKLEPGIVGGLSDSSDSEIILVVV